MTGRCGRRWAPVALLVLGVALAGLAGCGAEPERSGASGSAPSWAGTDNGHQTGSWQPGDQASWEAQMRRRAQGQNEYARIGGAS